MHCTCIVPDHIVPLIFLFHLDLTVQVPTPMVPASLYSGSPPAMFKFVHYEACQAGVWHHIGVLSCCYHCSHCREFLDLMWLNVLTFHGGWLVWWVVLFTVSLSAINHSRWLIQQGLISWIIINQITRDRKQWQSSVTLPHPHGSGESPLITYTVYQSIKYRKFIVWDIISGKVICVGMCVRVCVRVCVSEGISNNYQSCLAF